jgi:hypothetical protein
MNPRIKKILVLAFSLFTGVFLLTHIGLVNASRGELVGGLNPGKVSAFGQNVVGPCSNLAIVTSTADSGTGSLRDAITSVCAGGTVTFDPALTSGGPAVITLLTALPDLSSNMTIEGPGSNRLTVQRSTAQGTPDFRIFFINNRNVTISGMTITNGKTPDGASGTTGGSAQSGGGILQAGGILTLTDLVITGNRTGNGGAATGGSTSFGGDGGFGGGISSSGTLTMTNCVVSNNTTGNGGSGGYGHSGGYGGGIQLGSGSATLTNVTVSGNRTGDGGVGINSGYSGGNSGGGGGIYSSQTTLNMFNVNVTNNVGGNTTRGDAGSGGGIMIYSGTATLTNSTVADNLTGSALAFPGRGGVGGGIANFGTLTVTGSTVSGNTTGDSEPSQGTSGGGIYNGFVLTVINSTISGNRLGGGGNYANSGGGGIVSTTLTTITNSTVTANAAPQGSGGGVWGNDQITVSNTIIAGNSASESADVKGTLKSQGYNLIGKSDGTNGFTNGVNGDQVGTDASPVNALLDSLSLAGGPTRTHLLLPGSPAINAGSNALAKDQSNNPLATDQRGAGYPRIINSTVDVGAVEVSHINHVINATAGTPQSVAISQTFPTQLQVTVTAAGAPSSNVPVAFTAPSTGASGTFAGGSNTTVTVMTDSNGVATAPAFTANATAGSYSVVASLNSGTPSVPFSLTNLKGLAQVNLGNLEQTYDGTQKSVTATTNPSGLSVVVTYEGSTTPPTVSGSYAVVATVNDVNYNGLATGTLIIKKANAIVSLSNLTHTYNNTPRSATATTNPSGLGVNFSYSQNGSPVTSPINVGTYNVTATINSQNYQGSATDVLVINKATPVIFWSNPANIIVGTPLSSTQLNAAANVPGTLQYNPPAGTVLSLGTAQLSTTFTPNDTANYETATKSVQLVVDPVPPPALTLGNTFYIINESAGQLAVIVNRTGDPSPAVTVNYETDDNAGLTSCNTFNGVASARCDYAITLGILRFAAGETSKTIYVPLVDDSYAEGSETFTIRLSNPSGASLGSATSASVSIADNEATSGKNPIVDVPFFVRQHYIDFLGREPEPQGFAAWQEILNKCVVGDTSCDRIAVSSGFFRSPEFQDRGYFIYRFYATSLGRTPRYSEFIPDMAKVSGFLDTQQLEANKVAFINEFMARAEFSNRYGTATDPTTYVDGLLYTAGLQNHPSRNTWINGLTSGTISRAGVLRGVVESAEAYNKFYNEGFVVMQYFGYLRRDPDILYLEWIRILNQNSADYRNMINGFMNSPEYAARFGQ